MNLPVIIFGASSLGKAALDIFNSSQIVTYGFLDDDKSLHGQEINDIPVLGATDDAGFLKLIGKKISAFVAVDDNALRRSLVKLLNERRKVMPMNAIHRAAAIPDSVHVGHGNFINAGVMVGAGAKISNHCLIHTGTIIEHECTLGDYVQLGPGSIINPGTSIGEGAFIGSGVTVVSGIKIGANAQVGAGSVVIRNVEDGETVFGNPAEKMDI